MFTRNLFIVSIILGLCIPLRAQAANANDGCGSKTVQLSPGKQSVVFPLDNQEFSDQTNCVITIKSPEQYTTSTFIEKISIEDSGSSCAKGYFRVASTEVGLQSVDKKCGMQASTAELLKASGSFFLEINMSGMTSKATFTLAFNSIGPNDGCGTNAIKLDAGTQSVTFPLDGQAFSERTSCIITVTPPEGYTTSTSVESITIPKSGPTCNEGYFQVAATKEALIKANEICGTDAIADILKASGPFYIQIIMAGMKTAPKFTLKFISAGPNDGCGNKTLQLNAGTESIKFPLKDQPFSDKTDCIVTVSPPTGATTFTSIESIAIDDPNSNCDQGYFKVATTTANLSSATKRCGTSAMADILQASDPFYVQIIMAGMKKAPTFTLKFVSGVSRMLASSILTTMCIFMQNLYIH